MHVWSSQAGGVWNSLSGCRVKPRRPKPPGFTRQPENSKRAHLSAPAFRNTTKIPREDPHEREERTKNVWEREKKSDIFGPFRGRGRPAEGAVLRRGALRRRGGGSSGPTKNLEDTLEDTTHTTHTHGQNTQNTNSGQMRFGQMRSTL